MKFDLTDTERLILANQYEILDALKPNQGYGLTAETLRNGHKWLYEQALEWMSPDLPGEKTEHVLNILEIFSGMKDSYDRLDDKGGINAKDLEFPGFDGNNESDLLSFASSLIKHGRYEDTLGEHARNSHMPTTEMYQRMITKWRELGQPRFPFSKTVIEQIIEARTHPDYRK